MDMESHNSNNGFEVRNPSRSESFVSESTYNFIGSDSGNQQQKSVQDDIKIPIKRRLPLVADAVIFLTQLLLAGCFIYFAYFYKPIDTLTCYAAYGSDQPIVPG